jgi:endonuclease YncB( thermonuclease family)
VIDGDTVELMIDLGIKTFKHETLRLLGINTPELNSRDPLVREQAHRAKEFLVLNLPTAKNALLVRTVKDTDDKYGRLLVTIFVGDINVNEMMLSLGYAVRYS